VLLLLLVVVVVLLLLDKARILALPPANAMLCFTTASIDSSRSWDPVAQAERLRGFQLSVG